MSYEDFSYKDILKMMLDETINQAEGYTNPLMNELNYVKDLKNPNSFSSAFPNIKMSKVYPYKLDNVIDISNIDNDGWHRKWKFGENNNGLRKVVFPKAFYAQEYTHEDLPKYIKHYEVPSDYIKYENNVLDKIKNRVPTKSLEILAEKLSNEPMVKGIGKVLHGTGKVLEGSAIPVTVLDMLKLQGAYPYSKQQYKQMLNDMGVDYNNGQIKL